MKRKAKPVAAPLLTYSATLSVMPTDTPAKPRKLTPRQRKFASEYPKDLNGQQAAIRAGYAPESAQVEASRLLSKAIIAEAVEVKVSKALTIADVTAQRTLQELARCAYGDIAELFDVTGNLKPVQEISEDARRSIQSIEVIKKNAEAGDGHTDVVHKVRLADKLKALEILAKYCGLLVDKVEVSVHVQYTDRVSEIRKVLAERRQGAIDVEAAKVEDET